MHAAVVHSFGQVPRYGKAEDPQATTENEVVVNMLAAGLHPRVRSGAAGSHYASSTQLPLIPGIDGVGRLPDGQRVYVLALDVRNGTMADQVLVRRNWCLPVPDEADGVAVAAAINPAMSSWVPLRHRVGLQPGQRVLVLGATGAAGRMAVQIARLQGAGWVGGVGRDPAKLATLAALGTDATVPLTGDSATIRAAVQAAAPDVDVVIDYLWGEPAETVLPAVLAARSDPSRPLTWLHIGAIAGQDIQLPSAALRAHNLTVLGSGQGALATATIAGEIPAIMAELAAGTLNVDALPVPLSEVEATWNAPQSHVQRVVFIP